MRRRQTRCLGPAGGHAKGRLHVFEWWKEWRRSRSHARCVSRQIRIWYLRRYAGSKERGKAARFADRLAHALLKSRDTGLVSGDARALWDILPGDASDLGQAELRLFWKTIVRGRPGRTTRVRAPAQGEQIAQGKEENRADSQTDAVLLQSVPVSSSGAERKVQETLAARAEPAQVREHDAATAEGTRVARAWFEQDRARQFRQRAKEGRA